MALIGIVMGSKSDEKLMQPALDTLKQMGIEYEVSVISAHRNPEEAREFGLNAEKRGVELIIAGAGKAAGWSAIPNPEKSIWLPETAGRLMVLPS